MSENEQAPKIAPGKAKDILAMVEEELLPNDVAGQMQRIKRKRLREGTARIKDIMTEYQLSIQSRQEIVNGVPGPISFFFVLSEENR